MSASIELPAHPHASADLEDDLYQDVPDVSTNNGQIAGIVHGGMHQHKTIIENKLMSDLITRHHLTPAYIGHVMRAFAPRKYRLGDITLDRARASRLVTTESWTVLCGAPNSGLRTAAVALLHEPSHGGLRLEEILIDEERERRFTGGDLPAERGVIYLLRLPDQPDRVSPDLARRLHVHGTHLATIDAHLLVVTTPDVWQIAGGGRPTTFIEVSPPATADVARQECADAGAKAAQVIEHTAIVQVLEKAAVADAARLARIVVTAVRRSPEAQLESLVQEVQGAYRNWDDELARWFNDEKNGLRARLFLVAAAMLEGEQAATILSTANALGKRLGDLPTAHPDGLAEAGLRTLTKVINAEIVDTRLRFQRAYYASAVLSFIHVDRSAAFRKGLWEWAIDLPLAERRGTAAERVVEMLVAMVLRHGDTRPLVRLVGWTGRSDLRPYVVQALTSTAVSDEVGVEVRALLYRWSRSSASDEHSLCTIAEVCSGELAELYPRVSLTRLGHLATRESVPVREAVVNATLRLWERPRLRRRVLDALIIWLGDDSDARTETAWQALTALASTDVHPVSYAAVEITTRRALTRAAARLFDRPGRVDLTSPFGASLLDAALRSADQENLVTDLLRDVVSCGDGGSKRLVRISRLAFEWQPVNADEMRPAHRDLRDRLCEALHQADPLSAEV